MHRNLQYFVLVRHGQSHKCVAVENGSDDLYYNIQGNDREIELTQLGMQQAYTSGLWLAPLFPPDHPIEQMWLSGFTRVAQSGEQIVKALGYRPMSAVDSRLEKRSYGRFWNLTLEGIRQLYPDEYALLVAQGPLLYCPPEGENYLTFFHRVGSFVRERVEPATGHLLVPAHLAVMVAILGEFGGVGATEAIAMYERMHFPNGGILMLCRPGPGHRWKLCQPPYQI